MSGDLEQGYYHLLNSYPVIALSDVFKRSLFILRFSDRVTSFSDKQDRKCCSANRITFHCGLSSWLLNGNAISSVGVICITRGKGNDKAREIRFDYLPVSYQLEALRGNIKSVTRGSIILEPYYKPFICWVRFVKGGDPSKRQ